MSSEQISLVAGALLSLVFSYLPGLRDWFNALDGGRKQLVVAVALAAVAIGATALSCAKVITAIECSQSGVIALAVNFVLALSSNQATYLITRATKPIGGDTLPPTSFK